MVGHCADSRATFPRRTGRKACSSLGPELMTPHVRDQLAFERGQLPEERESTGRLRGQSVPVLSAGPPDQPFQVGPFFSSVRESSKDLLGVQSLSVVPELSYRQQTNEVLVEPLLAVPGRIVEVALRGPLLDRAQLLGNRFLQSETGNLRHGER